MLARRLGVLAMTATAGLASLLVAVQPAAASVPMPRGVPGSEVGALETNATTGTGLLTWHHTLQGAQCTTSGKFAHADGLLKLYTSGKSGSCAEVTSNRTFTGGIFEARIYYSGGAGGKVADWPAFWLLGSPWPWSGELDIAEGLHGFLSAAYHYNAAGSNPASARKPAYTDLHYLTTKPGWYTVDAVWAPHSITIYYNGVRVWSLSSSVIVAKPVHIMLDNLTGTDGLQPARAQWMDIAWVRVWRYR